MTQPREAAVIEWIRAQAASGTLPADAVPHWRRVADLAEQHFRDIDSKP